MFCSKKIVLLLVAVFAVAVTFSQQTKFSLATDLSVLRSLKEEQRYWSIGQTVSLHFHFTRKDGAYAWLSYYSDGRFGNNLTATAKSPSTTPSTINYRNSSELRIKHISLGWKRYLKGSCDKENGLNIYGYAGFGLMFGRVSNTHSTSVDTSSYYVPVQSGLGHFKRLTLDIGLGLEVPVGADVYLYTEGRVLVPTTDYPSNYLFVNENAPFTIAANIGIRILLY